MVIRDIYTICTCEVCLGSWCPLSHFRGGVVRIAAYPCHQVMCAIDLIHCLGNVFDVFDLLLGYELIAVPCI